MMKLNTLSAATAGAVGAVSRPWVPPTATLGGRADSLASPADVFNYSATLSTGGHPLGDEALMERGVLDLVRECILFVCGE